MSIILWHSSPKRKTSVFYLMGKWWTGLRHRNSLPDYSVTNEYYKVQVDKTRKYGLVKHILTSIPMALIWLLLSIAPVQAPLDQQNIAIPTTQFNDPVLAKPRPKKLVLVRKFVVDRKATATVTGYTNSFASTGKTPASRAYGITSTGTHTKQGRTIAVDPKLIPYGSLVRIDGKVYEAEDTGGAIRGYAIDLYFKNTHDAIRWGRRHLPVEIGHLEKQWVLKTV